MYADLLIMKILEFSYRFIFNQTCDDVATRFSVSVRLHTNLATTGGISTSYAHLEEQSTDIPRQRKQQTSVPFSAAFSSATALSSRVTQASLSAFLCSSLISTCYGKGDLSRTRLRDAQIVFGLDQNLIHLIITLNLMFNMKSKYFRTLYLNVIKITKCFEILVILKYYLSTLWTYVYDYVVII